MKRSIIGAMRSYTVRNQSYISGPTYRRFLFLLATFLLSNDSTRFALAGWVDPDTPEDVKTTVSLSAKIPKLEKPTGDDDDYLSLNETAAPTATPTASPTDLPTVMSDTRNFELVFSDEFNVPHRTFEDGVDPRWTAIDKNDYTNDAMHYYSPNNVATDENGQLVITTEAADTPVLGFDDVNQKKTHVTKHFRSAMLQTWNKFCFTGGIVEAEVQLPGKSNVGGLWPAFWLLGNLARHTYVGSSSHVWPWSSSKCHNENMLAQRFSACNHAAHYGMKVGVGRGAPEIDIFEVQPGPTKANTGVFLESSVGQPFMSASYQVAPGRPSGRPGPGYWPGPDQWYKGLKQGNETNLNILFYGTYNHFAVRGVDVPSRKDYWSDAISINRQLHPTHFNTTHRYRLEWDLPSEESEGYLHWFIDDQMVFALNGSSLESSGYGSEISTEPMYILLNTAVSKQWGFPEKCPTNCKCKAENYDCYSTDWGHTCGFPNGFCDMMKKESPTMKVNYVRVYQNPNDGRQKVGCSTPERPTRKFIEAYSELYKKEGDVSPLKGITRGRGFCDPKATGSVKAACGGMMRGRCTQGRVCECAEGWVGPHCLVHEGYDDILYDTPDKISDIGFEAPAAVFKGLWVFFIAFVVVMLAALQLRKRMDHWTPIPDSEYS